MARTRQPQGPVRVNSRLNASSAAVHTSILARCAVTGRVPDIYGGSAGTKEPTLTIGPQGYGVTTYNSTIAVRCPRYQDPQIGTSFTVIALAMIPSDSTAKGILDSDNYASDRHWSLTTDNSYVTNGLVFFNSGSGAVSLTGPTVTPNKPFVAALVSDGVSASVWANGISGTPVTITGTPAAGIDHYVVVGGTMQHTSYLDDNHIGGATVFGWVIVPRALSNNDILAITATPEDFWGNVFAPQRRLWIQLGAASGGAGATGTSAATLASVTGTAAGTLAIAAASAATLGAVTGTAAGEAAIAGTSAQSLAATTGTAAATLAIAATSAATLAATTGTAAGTLAIAATSAETIGAVTGAANGTTLGAASGTSAATLANTTGTAAGTLALAATSSATVGIVTGTSAGTISIGGASAQTLNDVTGVAVGNTTGVTNGVSIVTLDSVSGSAAGYADILATSSGALDAISGTAAGAISIIGVSADILADVTCGVPPPTLPLEVPTSSRTLAAAVIRLGASPTRKAPPRLG